MPDNQGFSVVVGGREHPGPPGPGGFFSPWNCETLPVVPEGTHISDVVTDKAIAYIKSNSENPFLLCLWYYDVHAPFQAKEELKEKYKAKLTTNHIQRSPTMGAMIETMDLNVGRVLQTVRDLQLEDDTIVIFTSDNGGNMYDGPDRTTPTNNYPLRAGKGNNYEGGVRVPMIVRVPGITKARTTSEVVTSSVDHYASLLDLLDIPFPKDVTTDGVSYVKALKNQKYERAPIYSTFCHNVVATGNRANISMRQGPWRLYKFYYDGPNREHRYELYQLDNDIGETKNLAAQMPQRVKEMTQLLDAHVKEAGILLPQKNKNYTGNVADAWSGSEHAKISVSDKILYIRAKGTKPTVETVYTPNVKDDTFYLKFKMKSTGKGDGNISWKSGEDKIYSNQNKVSFTVTHDGQWHSYKVEIPLKGRLNTIRIQPSKSKGKMELRHMELVNVDDHYIRDWPLY
ncbi:MAG: sulfatase-like hydrolase/transferase [Saonia sp.]